MAYSYVGNSVSISSSYEGSQVMPKPSELAVTLSSELYKHLAAEARRLEVPLEWLVAAMVLDTLGDGSFGPVAA